MTFIHTQLSVISRAGIAIRFAGDDSYVLRHGSLLKVLCYLQRSWHNLAHDTYHITGGNVLLVPTRCMAGIAPRFLVATIRVVDVCVGQSPCHACNYRKLNRTIFARYNNFCLIIYRQCCWSLVFILNEVIISIDQVILLAFNKSTWSELQ